MGYSSLFIVDLKSFREHSLSVGTTMRRRSIWNLTSRSSHKGLIRRLSNSPDAGTDIGLGEIEGEV